MNNPFSLTDREIKKMQTCYYCGLLHPRVEAQGVFHCANLMCSGPGAAWFRRTLESFHDEGSGHTVDHDEWLLAALAHQDENKDYIVKPWWEIRGMTPEEIAELPGIMESMVNIIEKLRELSEKATAGPWEFKGTSDSGGIRHAKNGELIATMRNALPKFLEIVSDLEWLHLAIEKPFTSESAQNIRLASIETRLIKLLAKLREKVE